MIAGSLFSPLYERYWSRTCMVSGWPKQLLIRRQVLEKQLSLPFQYLEKIINADAGEPDFLLVGGHCVQESCLYLYSVRRKLMPV